VPEGPELRYSRDVIRKIVTGGTVRSLSFGPNSRYSSAPPEGFREFSQELPAKIVSVDVKGKFMWWTLQGETTRWYMWCTYGMSGQWSTKKTKHWAAQIDFDVVLGVSGSIHFNDPRHFGTLKFVNDDSTHRKKLAGLGPDVLSDNLEEVVFVQNILKNPTRTIAESLMDQKTISGVGNYMKSEALFRSKISPWRIVSDISAEEYISLRKSVIEVATESYSSQGASISTYRNPDGEKGTTQFNFQIYSRELCPLSHVVRKEQTPEGRTSHWCEMCQK